MAFDVPQKMLQPTRARYDRRQVISSEVVDLLHMHHAVTRIIVVHSSRRFSFRALS